MLKRFRYCLALCTLTLIAFASPLSAQESRGTLQGRVTDSSGAAVPGATVEVLNLATGVVTTSTTNEQGSYRAPLLNPGSYRVTVSLSGFSKFVSDQIELHVADVLTVDATMKVGAVSDEVTVTATAATVDRTTAELGQVVDARRIAELPIREGSPVELVILAPGVTVTTDLRSRKAAFNNGLSQFSTDGVGEKKNDFTTVWSKCLTAMGVIGETARRVSLMRCWADGRSATSSRRRAERRLASAISCLPRAWAWATSWPTIRRSISGST